MARLTANSYGKAAVRLTKVVRHGAVHTLFEFNVEIMLEGKFEAVYLEGDNSRCIPTDTMKNTVYALAKKHEFESGEEFARILAGHFIETFLHVFRATVTLEQVLWDRIVVDGKPHDHSFAKSTTARRTATARAQRGEPITLTGGVTGLEVIKTTKSGFAGFLRDQYTTLKETTDRIFGTSVDAAWTYDSAEADFNAGFAAARRAILDVFATHDSLGVQQTIFAMGEAVLAAVPAICEISFTMPNQHRLLVNLEPFKMTNSNEIFVTTSEPFGLIKGTLAR